MYTFTIRTWKRHFALMWNSIEPYAYISDRKPVSQ